MYQEKTRAKRIGVKLEKDDSLFVTLKEGVDPSGVALLLQGRPMSFMLTEVHKGCVSFHSDSMMPKAARIAFSTPSGVFVHTNKYKWKNEPNIHGNVIEIPSPTENHKCLSLNRHQGQSFVIIKCPDVSAEEAVRDLRDNGIHVGVNICPDDRSAKIIIKASLAWTVVRSEIYLNFDQHQDMFAPYHKLLIEPLVAEGDLQEQITSLANHRERVTTALNEIELLTLASNKRRLALPADLVSERAKLVAGFEGKIQNITEHQNRLNREFYLETVNDKEFSSCIISACRDVLPPEILNEVFARARAIKLGQAG